MYEILLIFIRLIPILYGIYLLNCLLQLLSQDYNLDSHTIHIVCIKFVNERLDPQSNADILHNSVLRKFSWQLYLHSASSRR